jgi:3'-phosphoadenosine 5'-phosphosulfate sulfotransferase (PAPS reductase)/FAD synthetase
MQIEEKIQKAVDRIHRAIKLHDPIAVFGLFSGGHDSLAATLIARESQRMTSALHVNTGIGVPATRDFVRQTCKDLGCPLIEKCATQNVNAEGELDPQIYEDLVTKWGFPGPPGHGMMYARLKERGLESIARDFGATCRGKQKRRVMFISGCRSDESRRRMANTEEIQIDGRRIWVAPIHDFSKLDCSLVVEAFKAKRNPVVDLIHKSGECLCGAFANSDRENELEELNLWDLTRPAYDEIKRIEAIVKPIHGWGWGDPVPENLTKNGQMVLFPGMLCQSCQKV